MSSNQGRVLAKKLGTKGAFALVIIALLAFFVLNKHTPIPLTDEARAWSQAIKTDGADKAYKDFQASVASLDQGTQHADAHSFGAALYSAKGIDAFPLCRDIFQYGCAHGFIATALQTEGMQVVAHFADVCRAQGYPGMCLHGIGHGLVSYLGYDDAALQKAVSACRDIAHDTSTAGCIGGSVMEFGQKTMAIQKDSRVMTPENSYEPCLSLAPDAKSACYFWNAGWWYTRLNYIESLTPEAAVKKMGQLCASQKETEYIGECFAGLGDIVAMASNYKGAEAVRMCDSASRDPSERLYCKAYAADIFLGDARTRPDAFIVCNSLPSDEKNRCMYLAQMGVGVFDRK